METAFFSASSLFHADDDSDDGGGSRDEMQAGTEGEKEEQQQALEYEERFHKFPGMELSIREFSCHQLNANLLWPGTFFFAEWLVKNPSIIVGQRILELGSGTGALAIFMRKSFGVDITTSDYDDKEIEENIAHNCGVNNLDALPHIRHTWGDPFPIPRPNWNIVIASDILLYVKQYPNLITTLSFLLKESEDNSQGAGCTNITTKSGIQVVARYPMFLMSWRRRIGKDQSLFFEGCEKAGLEVQHLGDLVYLINNKN
ncbi:methyltransferase-like protein 23 [Brachypodium distachyon]|nr:methyltransferase-like protein 23 [Brachypodium distachyon]|eukprot:XP_003563258.1 methyltransferase-like protein 23 [Brachypodium distachyon]